LSFHLQRPSALIGKLKFHRSNIANQLSTINYQLSSYRDKGINQINNQNNSKSFFSFFGLLYLSGQFLFLDGLRIVLNNKMPNPHYAFYCEDLTSVARWVTDGPNRASVLPLHLISNLKNDKNISLESLVPKAKKYFYLAYPIKNKHQELINKILEIKI